MMKEGILVEVDIELYDVFEVSASKGNDTNKDKLLGCSIKRVLFVDEVDEKVITIELNCDKIEYSTYVYTELIDALREKKIRKIEDPFNRNIELTFVDRKVNMKIAREKLRIEQGFLLGEKTKAEKIHAKHIERYNIAFEIVQLVVPESRVPECYRSRANGEQVAYAAEKYGVSKKTVYKYVRRYLQGRRSKYALFTDIYISNQIVNKKITKKLGRPSNIERLRGEKTLSPCTEEMEKEFTIAINYWYRSKQRNSLQSTYKWLIKNFYKEILLERQEETKKIAPIPTFRQFSYWYKTKYECLMEDLIKREGETKFRNDFRGLNADVLSQVMAPAQVYEIDATTADVYLINRINGKYIVNRPTIYLAVDVYTGMITGLHISLEAPGISPALSLIYNMIEDKQAYCNRVADIEISQEEWPAQGIPNVIVGDRGELVSKQFHDVIEGLGVTFKNTPPCLGSAKGVVEQCFNVLNITTIHNLPGHIECDYRKRREPDYRLDAVLTIEEFTRIIIATILHRNKKILINRKRTPHMIKNNVQATPIALWNEGKKSRGLIRNFPKEQLILILLRPAKASIVTRGIYFLGAYYTCNHPRFTELKVRAANKGVIKIEVRYDQRDINQIYWINEEDHRIVTCNMAETYHEYEIFHNRTYEEIQDYCKNENENKLEQVWNQAVNDINLSEKVNQEISTATERQKEITPDIKNIDTAKKLSREESKKKQAIWKNEIREIISDSKKQEKFNSSIIEKEGNSMEEILKSLREAEEL